METTKNELPQNTKDFFYHLSDYLDNKLFYFGSVQRSDYFPGKSDIDIDIFPENEYSLMNKMQHYLHVSKKDFKKIACIINGVQIYGYKLKYKNDKKDINAEFSIYNEMFKKNVLDEHNKKQVLPFHLNIYIYILKFFYYQIPILNTKTFYYLKNLALNSLSDDTKFLVIDSL
jgi:hypothetical protein